MKNNPVSFTLAREAIENMDFSEFNESLGMEVLRSKPEMLKQLYNNVILDINGYDDFPGELYQIPEVRMFFQKLVEEWPVLYFCHLGSDNLKIIAGCCLENFKSEQNESTYLVSLTFELKELMCFIVGNLKQMYAACPECEKSRTMKIFEYFNIDMFAESGCGLDDIVNLGVSVIY